MLALKDLGVPFLTRRKLKKLNIESPKDLWLNRKLDFGSLMLFNAEDVVAVNAAKGQLEALAAAREVKPPGSPGAGSGENKEDSEGGGPKGGSPGEAPAGAAPGEPPETGSLEEAAGAGARKEGAESEAREEAKEPVREEVEEPAQEPGEAPGAPGGNPAQPPEDSVSRIEGIRERVMQETEFGVYVMPSQGLGGALSSISRKTGLSREDIGDRLGVVFVSCPKKRAETLSDEERELRRFLVKLTYATDPGKHIYLYLRSRSEELAMVERAAEKAGTDVPHVLARLGFVRLDRVNAPRGKKTPAKAPGDPALKKGQDAAQAAPSPDPPEGSGSTRGDEAAAGGRTEALIARGRLHGGNRAALELLEERLQANADAFGTVRLADDPELARHLYRCAMAEGMTPVQLLSAYRLNGTVPKPDELKKLESRGSGSGRGPSYSEVLRRNITTGSKVCLIPGSDDFRAVKGHCASLGIGAEAFVKSYGYELLDTRGITPREQDIRHFRELSDPEGNVSISKGSEKYREIEAYARTFGETYGTYAERLGFSPAVYGPARA